MKKLLIFCILILIIFLAKSTGFITIYKATGGMVLPHKNQEGNYETSYKKCTGQIITMYNNTESDGLAKFICIGRIETITETYTTP